MKNVYVSCISGAYIRKMIFSNVYLDTDGMKKKEMGLNNVITTVLRESESKNNIILK